MLYGDLANVERNSDPNDGGDTVDFDFDFSRRGRFRVLDPDGTEISSHTSIEYAQEAAVRHAMANRINGDYTIEPPVWSLKTMGFGVTPVQGPDSVPDAFSFQDVTDAAASAVVESNVLTPFGYTVPVSVSVENGEYRIDGGAYTTLPGTITPAQTVQVRHTTAADAGQTVTTTLSIGGVGGTFRSTTQVVSGGNELWTEIVPEDFGIPGAVQFRDSHVNLSSPGIATIYVERCEGAQGACQVTVATYSITGACAMVAGADYTAVSEVLTWDNGENGVKSVDVAVLALPEPGIHLIGLELTNGSAGLRLKTPNAYIKIDDGGVNPNGTIVDTSTGNQGNIANANNNAPGNIVVGDIAGAISGAIPGDLIYVRAGTYFDNRRLSGKDTAGIIVNNSGTRTAPIQVVGYPGDAQPVIDQLEAGSNDGQGKNRLCAMTFLNNASYIHIRGIECTRSQTGGFASLEQDGGEKFGLVFYDVHPHDIAGTENIGGIRLDQCSGAIVSQSRIHDIYDTRVSSNGFNSVPFGGHSGIHGYAPQDCWIEYNDIYNVERAVYQKDASNRGGESHRVNNNKFWSFDGAGVDYDTPGQTDGPHTNGSVFRNLMQPISANLLIGMGDAGHTGQPTGLFAYGNTFIGDTSSTVFGGITQIVGARFYSNSIKGARRVFVVQNDDTENTLVEYIDYNNYVDLNERYGIFDQNTANVTNIASLSAMQALDQSTVNTLANTPDMENNSSETTPTFVNETGDITTGDYRNTNLLTAGYAGRPMGIGDEQVGRTI
ncbi:MAG: hypothetical protein QNK05_20985 [Myxococcota bacterium]|nr:hypothetical protein [Myxococcota bacterium]